MDDAMPKDWAEAGAAGAIVRDADVIAGRFVPELALPAPNERSRRKLPVLDFADIRPVGNVLTLVNGLLASAAMSLVIGASGVGKSFIVLDLALAIARGIPYRGLSTEQGGVLYVATEGAHGIRQRVEAYRREHGIAEPVPFALVPASIDLTSSGDDAEAVIEAAKEAAERFGFPVVLIVVDTLHRAYAGADENDAGAAGSFLRLVDRIREATGAHVMCIHHLGKDAERGGRGSSALKAAVDTEITLTASEESGAIIGRVTKQKDGPDGTTLSFRLRPVEIGTDDEGAAILCPVVDHLDISEVPKVGAKLTDRQALAMRALHNHFAGTDQGAVGLDVFRTIMLQAAVLEEDTPRQRFTDLRQQLEKRRLIVCRDGQISLARGGRNGL